MHPESDTTAHSRPSLPARILSRLRAMLAEDNGHRAKNGARRLRAERGMTLIEIMVVMALIGIIGTVVAVNVIGAQQDGDADAAGILVNTTVPNALTDYYRRKREFPESLQVLVDMKKLKANQIVDPWNTPLIYEPGTTDFKICSAGVDKRAGSQDDICNSTE
jgi:general secretion pathway protein G